VLDAAERGEDLLDARTWKNILESEWAEAVDAGLNTEAALNGDVIALVEVLNYVFEQITGFGFFDTLQGLKIADRLGIGWYDDAIEWLTKSKYFDDLAGKTIGTGHAWGKHGDKYAGILSTQDEFVDLIEDIIRNPDATRSLERGRKAYWDSATGTVVIFDPGHPDFGTAFPPDRGYIFFRDVLQ